MQPQHNADQAEAAEAIEHHWQTGTYSHAEAIAAPQLVFTRLPSGDYEYLRPEDSDAAPRYVLTDKGRAAIGRDAA